MCVCVYVCMCVHKSNFHPCFRFLCIIPCVSKHLKVCKIKSLKWSSLATSNFGCLTQAKNLKSSYETAIICPVVNAVHQLSERHLLTTHGTKYAFIIFSILESSCLVVKVFYRCTKSNDVAGQAEGIKDITLKWCELNYYK